MCACCHGVLPFQRYKTEFWNSTNLYGLDVSCLTQEASAHHFAVTVIGVFAPSMLLAPGVVSRTVDFATLPSAEAVDLTLPFSSVADHDGQCRLVSVVGGWRGTGKHELLISRPSQVNTESRSSHVLFYLRELSRTLSWKCSFLFYVTCHVQGRVTGWQCGSTFTSLARTTPSR